MAGSDTGEKTEAPTAKKLRELRKHNTVRRSHDLPSAFSLIALVMTLPWLAHSLYDAFLAIMQTSFVAAGSVDAQQAPHLLAGGLNTAFSKVLGPVLVVCLAVVVANVGYTRAKPNLAAVKPQWKSLHPKQGIKRVVSMNSLVELGKGLGKIGAVSAVAYGSWKSGVLQLLSGVDSVESFASSLGSSVHSMLVKVAIVALGIGALDAVYQSRRYNKQARMSKYEVTKEFKQTEGDPMVKAQIRQRGQAMTRNAMVAAAADADVIVVNPTHIAVALAYDPSSPAPRVVAKGAGHIATRIREVAAEAGVPVRRDVPLARALHKSVDVGQWIPVEMYTAAAKLLAEVYKERRKPGGTR